MQVRDDIYSVRYCRRFAFVVEALSVRTSCTSCSHCAGVRSEAAVSVLLRQALQQHCLPMGLAKRQPPRPHHFPGQLIALQGPVPLSQWRRVRPPLREAHMHCLQTAVPNGSTMVSTVCSRTGAAAAVATESVN